MSHGSADIKQEKQGVAIAIRWSWRGGGRLGLLTDLTEQVSERVSGGLGRPTVHYSSEGGRGRGRGGTHSHPQGCLPFLPDD